jgi:hypothetical protein
MRGSLDLEIKTILLVHAVGVGLNLSFLPDELVHVGLRGEHFFFVMQLKMLIVVESVVCHCQLVGFKPDVPMVFFDPSVCGPADMSIHRRCCTHPVLQPQVVLHNTKEAGDLPEWQASTFDVVLMRLEVI